MPDVYEWLAVFSIVAWVYSIAKLCFVDGRVDELRDEVRELQQQLKDVQDQLGDLMSDFYYKHLNEHKQQKEHMK